MQPVLRFAPSPNGRLHLGHAYSALLNEALARGLGGRLLLRIEDIDPLRSRPDFERAIVSDLAWLGIAFDGPVRRQSERFDAYRAALGDIAARDLVYPCFCSRREVLEAAAAVGEPARDPDGAPLYPGTCRALAPEAVAARIARGDPHAWRLDNAAARRACPGPHRVACFEPGGALSARLARPEAWGDAVLARRDVPTSYHLAVVVDDADQGVTHVVRGADLERASDLHVLVQALLGVGSPRYHHHALIRDGEGSKLSKSLGSESLADLRARGVDAAAIRAALGFA